MARSKSVTGRMHNSIDEADPVGEIGTQHIEGVKNVVDKGAAKFWAKRGMKDPSTHGYNYGGKTAEAGDSE